MRAWHPLAEGTHLSLPAYLDADHAVVRPDGREHFFERFMQEQGLRRRVRLELSHFMSLLPVLESTDLLATVPTDIAQLFARYADVRLLALPVHPPGVAIRQYWHERVHKDAANVWLRGLIHAQFSSLTCPSAERAAHTIHVMDSVNPPDAMATPCCSLGCRWATERWCERSPLRPMLNRQHL